MIQCKLTEPVIFTKNHMQCFFFFAHIHYQSMFFHLKRFTALQLFCKTNNTTKSDTIHHIWLKGPIQAWKFVLTSLQYICLTVPSIVCISTQQCFPQRQLQEVLTADNKCGPTSALAFVDVRLWRLCGVTAYICVAVLLGVKSTWVPVIPQIATATILPRVQIALLTTETLVLVTPR